MFNTKILVIFVFLLALFAASFVIENETWSFTDNMTYESVSSGGKEISAYFFYGQGCPHCDRVEPFIDQVGHEQFVKIYKYEIYQHRENLALLNEYFDVHAVPSERRGVPALFVSDSYFVGDEPILSEFQQVVGELLKQDSKVVQASDFEAENPKMVEANVCVESAGSSGCLSIFTVTVAALVDSVSPCSLAVLLFLVGVRPLVSDRRKRGLKVGLAFSFSVFITYTLFGLGLLSVIGIAGLSSAFGVIAGVIAILVGIFYIKDYFWRGGGGFVMEVPRSLRPLVNRLIKGVASPVGAFLMGFVIAGFELPCTGGPYLFILGQLANTATRLQTIPVLLYYNFLFIAPLLLISVFLYFGCFSLKRAKQWNASNKGILRLISGIIITALGILVIPTSQLVELTGMLLGCCRVVLPPVLFILSCYLLFSMSRVHQIRIRRLAKTILLVALPILTIFAYPQMFRNVQVDVVANVGYPDIEPAVTDVSSVHTREAQQTPAHSETLNDSGDVGYEQPDGFADIERESMLGPEITRELTDEERAEIEERAKLYEDETVDAVVEQESEGETASSVCDGKSPGTANPASIYCIELGYKYKAVHTDEGEYGVCIFPDGGECEEWDFLIGKCGQEYSYCAEHGYDIKTLADGKNSLSEEYAVCVHNGEEVGSVTDLTNLSEKATAGSAATDSSKIEDSDASVSDPQAPSSFDWRNYNGYNWMTSVKNQNPCGSCWAFSAIGIVEAMYNIRADDPDLMSNLDLSEEFLVADCGCGWDCCGGWHYDALEHIRDYNGGNGISNQVCFPYVDYGCHCTDSVCDAPPLPNWCNYRTGGDCSDATCSDRCPEWEKRSITIDSYGSVSSDQATIKQKIVDQGPLSVVMGINQPGDWWDGDIYRCTNDANVNHAVIIAGYNDTGDYWIVKNSWGSTWNGDGYFKVGYGECAIESMVYYAEPEHKSCGETINSDTVLVNDILTCSGNGLVIGTSNITLDCQGHRIQGIYYSGYGIINTHNDVTIKNCLIIGFDYGIYMHDIADSNTLYNNDVSTNDYYGIYINNGWSNNLTHNDVNYNGYNGLYLYNYAKYNYIIDNDFELNGWHGVQIKSGPDGSSDSNDLIDNYLYYNGWSGMGIDTNNNLISGGWSTSNMYYGFHIASATGNTIQGCNIYYNNYDGIYLYNSTNTQLINNYVFRNDQCGVLLSISNYTTIEDSSSVGNLRKGLYLYDSHHNTIQTSHFYENTNESIYLYYADDNLIMQNDIMLGGAQGIAIWYSNNNIIKFNDIRSSENGLYLYQSDSNDIWYNHLEDNYGWSGELYYSDNNDFRYNVINHAIYYGLFSSNSYNTVFQNNTSCGYSWDFYTSSSTYTADENTCDSAYQFVDSGQPDACDFKCCGCRRPEDDLYAYRDLVFCPGTYNIQDPGNDGVIKAQADGITLTCNNTILDGVTDTGYGIYITDHSYVTVENCIIQNYERGVLISEAHHNNIIYNTITSNSWAGIHLLRAGINSLEHNTISLSNFGIRIFNTNYTNVRNNQIESNTNGIYMLSGASYNLIENNVVCANVRDIYDDLTGLGNLGDLNYCDVTSGYADSGQTSGCDYECSGCRKAENDLVVTENTQLCPYTYNIEDIGSVGVIIIGAHGVELDCRGAEIIGVSADSGYGIRNIGYDNVTIRNCKIYNYFIAIDFYSAADSARVLNNDVSSNAGGIRLWGSNYGYIGGNIANLNSQHGIVLTQNSDFNTIRNNVAEVNSISGIIAYAGSDYNTIELNDVASNYYGIYIHDSDQNYVHNNVVEDNTNTGVYFTATANNNELRHNRICANSLDISDEDNNYGDDNFCGTTNNWNDDGAEGCTFSCLLGDIDVDGDVDRYDFGIFALAYGSTAGDPSYELGADLDCDDDVDRYDFGIFALNYGKTS